MLLGAGLVGCEPAEDDDVATCDRDEWVLEASLERPSTGFRSVALHGDTLVTGTIGQATLFRRVSGPVSSHLEAVGAAWIDDLRVTPDLPPPSSALVALDERHLAYAGRLYERSERGLRDLGRGLTDDEVGAQIALDGDSVLSITEGLARVHPIHSGPTTWEPSIELGPGGSSLAARGGTAIFGRPSSAAADVYVRTEGTWSLEATLTSSTDASGFGVAVAADGDRVLVVSELEAELFIRGSTGWESEAVLSPGTGRVYQTDGGPSLGLSGGRAAVPFFVMDDDGLPRWEIVIFEQNEPFWVQSAILPLSESAYSPQVQLEGDRLVTADYELGPEVYSFRRCVR